MPDSADQAPITYLLHYMLGVSRHGHALSPLCSECDEVDDTKGYIYCRQRLSVETLSDS